MFGLFYGLFQYIFEKKEYSVLILGLDGAGKTTLLERLKGLYLGVQPLPPEKIGPTVGLNVGKLSVGGVRLLLWDLGGQTSLRVIWEKYYPEASAVIFVVDTSNPSRHLEALNTLQILMDSRELGVVPVLIFANKQDLCTNEQMSSLQSTFSLLSSSSPIPSSTSSPVAEPHDSPPLNPLSPSNSSGVVEPVVPRQQIKQRGITSPNDENQVNSNNAVSSSSNKRRNFGERPHPLKMIPVCAIDGEGLVDGMDWLIAQLNTGKYEKQRESFT